MDASNHYGTSSSLEETKRGQISTSKLCNDTISSSNPFSQTRVMQYHFQVKDLVGLTASFNYPDVLPVCRVVLKGTSVNSHSPKFKGRVV